MKSYLTGLILCTISFHAVAQFAPPVGQVGTTAMNKDSAAFVEWATGCSVVRGYQDISNTGLGYTTVGDITMALGKAGANGVVSLGDGGYAVVTFDIPITNGPGWDFAVFENSFSDTFLELAFVEVSSNGINYFRFPSISNTQNTVQIDNGGSIDATKINNLAGKYRALYGTPFDLNELSSQAGLDVNNITHIKIIDVVGCIQDAYATYDSNNNKVNDPWSTAFPSSGFDLDAVGVIHRQAVGINEPNNNIINLSVFPNPVESNLVIHYYSKQDASVMFMVTDITGRVLKEIDGIQQQGWNYVTVDMEEFNAGIYLLQLKTKEGTFIKKLIKQ